MGSLVRSKIWKQFCNQYTATTIDGSQSGHVVSFISGEDSTSILHGFTITNGSSSNGSGIYCSNSSPTIYGCTIRDNVAGYAVYLSQYISTISNNTITNNTGGGICCAGGNPNIVDNVITYNTGTTGGIECNSSCKALIDNNQICYNVGGTAGGIWCKDSQTLIINNIISNNSGGAYGGGIHFMRGYNDKSAVRNNLITDNRASGNGGGINVRYASGKVEIVNNTIVNNAANVKGGGLHYDRDTGDLLTDNIISNNSSHEGGGISLQDSASPAIERNIISGNYASGNGGGIWCTYNSSPTIRSNIVFDNSSDANGGGVYLDDNYSDFSNNVIYNNSAAYDGGGILCQNSSPKVRNNTVVGNVCQNYGGGFCCSSCFAEVANTIFWNNISGPGPKKEIYIYSGNPTFSHCDIEDGWPGTGNIDVDPLFVSLASRDFHLTWLSPCRDTGDNNAVKKPLDFEEDPRVAGGIVDMGADEFYYHLYHIGDVVPGSLINFRIIGMPTAPVTLALGSAIQDPPQVTQYGDLFLAWPIYYSGIGIINSDGFLDFPWTVFSYWQPGDERPFQALVGPLGNPNSVLTNLMVLTVE